MRVPHVPGVGTWDIARSTIGFVSGHDFSRAVTVKKEPGFSPCVLNKQECVTPKRAATTFPRSSHPSMAEGTGVYSVCRFQKLNH